MKFNADANATVDAELFEYTKEGIERIRNLLGSYLLSVSKERHMFAVGELRVKSRQPDGITISKLITEGVYVIKKDGLVFSLAPSVFESIFKEAE